MKACSLPAQACWRFSSNPASAQQVFKSASGDLKVETIASGLVVPWGLAFLPDGRLLVTERPGRMRIVTTDGKLSPPLGNVFRACSLPDRAACSTSSSIAISRRTAQSISAMPSRPTAAPRTTMARATLVADETPRLDNVKPIFQQDGPLSGGNHFGCRIVQMPDNNLFLTMGDHYGPRDQAQNLANHIGKIVRVRPDGSVPPDNPFVKQAGAKPEIWSYGHRNSQGAALNPASGKMWMHEHGPRGGDEVNIPEAGKNYGWPVIGYGVDYSGARIHEGTHKAGMEQPIIQWTPVIAPSGMAFYQGNLFPNWKGNLFIGGLVALGVTRLELDGEKVVREERLLGDLRERIRDVRSGPDGALWLLTDNSAGRVLRVSPAK